MIFTLTETERAAIAALDQEEANDLQAFVSVIDTYSRNSDEGRAAYRKYMADTINRGNIFLSLMEKFEADHFAKLKTKSAIIKDAEQLAKDAIVYAYVFLLETMSEEDKSKGHYIAGIHSVPQIFSPWAYDLESSFKEQRTKAFNPADSCLLLDAEQTISYITKVVIPKHIAALRNTSYAAKLERLINTIVYTSPYTADSDMPADGCTVLSPESTVFQSNMPMFHGKATDSLISFVGKEIAVNKAMDRGIVLGKAGNYDFKVVFDKFSKLKGNLSINTHKLLSVAIAEFTKTNRKGMESLNLSADIPFFEYARNLGYEIDERETDSPEAAEKEKKRANEAIKTARKRIKQDLEILYSMNWSWQEKIRGNPKDFIDIRIIYAKSIKNGYIHVAFSPEIAMYLKQLPLNQYHQGLLSIPARNRNSYMIGLKITEYFNMDSNQQRGVANRLKVSTLLEATNLPTIDSLKSGIHDNSRHWLERIKEPFESALDGLTGKVLLDWEYVKAKGVPLTTEEAYNISDFHVFENLYVKFEILNAPDHADRLSRRQEENKQKELNAVNSLSRKELAKTVKRAVKSAIKESNQGAK